MEIVNPSGALKNIYENIEKQCSKGCGTICKLKDAFKHEISCGRPNCVAFEKCGNAVQCVIDGFNVCSERCAIYTAIKQGRAIDPKNLSLLLTGLHQRQMFNTRGIHTFFYWDTQYKSDTLDISPDLKTVKNNATNRCFTTVVSKIGFTRNIHVVEMMVTTRPEKPVKIGLVSNLNFDKTKSFSDTPYGYAFYTLGQLRHNDHGKGLRYAKKLETETFNIAIVYDSEEGSISFLVNEVNQGIAFQDESLKDVTLYPAVALREGSKVTLVNQIHDYQQLCV